MAHLPSPCGSQKNKVGILYIHLRPRSRHYIYKYTHTHTHTWSLRVGNEALDFRTGSCSEGQSFPDAGIDPSAKYTEHSAFYIEDYSYSPGRVFLLSILGPSGLYPKGPRTQI